MITIEDSLAKMTNRLNHIVIDAYAPETTRWHRKYTECAEWYWLCTKKHQKDDNTHAMILSTLITKDRDFFMKQIENQFYDEYLCTFTTPARKWN